MKRLIGVAIGGLLLAASVSVPASAQVKWRSPAESVSPVPSTSFQIIAPKLRDNGTIIPLALASWSFVACKDTIRDSGSFYAELRSCVGVDPGVRQASFRVTFCSDASPCFYSDLTPTGNAGWDQGHRKLVWANPTPDQTLVGTFVQGAAIGKHTSTARSLIWDRTLGAGNFVYGRTYDMPIRHPNNFLDVGMTWDSQLCELTVDC